MFGSAAALLIPAPVVAEAYHGVGFAGVTLGSHESAGYAGAVVALPSGELGRGVAVRASLNGGRYEYVANGLKVEADYRGAEAALVYQMSGRWGWANFSAGPRLTKLQLSPRDPNNDRRGTELDLGLQVDGGWELREWRATWLSSIAVSDRAYLTQLALGRAIKASRQTRLGAEVGVQGDKHYTKISAGSFAASPLGHNVEGRVAAGLSHQRDREIQPYLSAAMTILL
jgi:hypothetical protein